MGVLMYVEGNTLRETISEIEYEAVLEHFCHPDLGEYYTYGIRMISFDSEEIIHDVSVCEYTVNHIVELLNLYQVSPVHMRDIVMDMLP